MDVRPKWIGKSILPEDNYSDGNSKCEPPNIYKDFRPLAVFSKILLILPIKDVFVSRGNLSFKILSLETAGVIILNVITGWVLPDNVNYLDMTPNINIEAVIMIISKLWLIMGEDTLINLLEKIDQFDHSLTFSSAVLYRKKINRFAWLLFNSIYPSLLLIYALEWMFVREYPCLRLACPVMELIRGFFRQQFNSVLFLYTFFCYEIKQRFHTLNDLFYSFIKQSYLGPAVVLDNAPQFENYRLQYTRLIQCTKILNAFFGWKFVLIFAGVILHVVFALYNFYTEKDFVINGFFLLGILSTYVVIFFVAHNTDLLVAESRKMERYLHEIPTRDLDSVTLFQLDHSYQQCEMFQVHISASELVPVDKSLLLSLVGAVSVYFIAILQMTTTKGTFKF